MKQGPIRGPVSSIWVPNRFESDDALSKHRTRDLEETRDVRSVKQILSETVFGCGVCAHLVNVLHDSTKLSIDFIAIPELPLAGLGHLERADRDPAGICCLAG